MVVQGINLAALLLFWVLVSYWREDLTIGHPAFNVKAQKNQLLLEQERNAPGRMGPETFDSLYSVAYQQPGPVATANNRVSLNDRPKGLFSEED